jgi:hypothetical protein
VRLMLFRHGELGKKYKIAMHYFDTIELFLI